MESVLERKVMVNSVNDSGNFKFIDPDTKLPRADTRAKESVTTEASTVSLSDVSQQISALKEMVLNSSEINYDRVQMLKEQLDAGRYQILSSRIAERMYSDFQLA
ncbi:flagellar biosynthesis anti-sigma factor FlgM [Legionella spiritensis]|uniref:Negative regulator of flagellin synthesis n=1 Tax=Legionella spiritensis TaxID=452 RepID=A0A0W0Z6R2_LEGSP|nr:flagellar biosynthesis anti-sigma factor FlgM [Legionella spiritensis]KTD64808.1 flagellin synthesis negative regulator [Legionella spiritensis]SNV40346.1 negative regulator of flagellin synthesis FlgM [Legionella spiritensis]VEG90449.1 negative regulator of flagellin synthesis FlgM [Legionella spiritensis]